MIKKLRMTFLTKISKADRQSYLNGNDVQLVGEVVEGDRECQSIDENKDCKEITFPRLDGLILDVLDQQPQELGVHKVQGMVEQDQEKDPQQFVAVSLEYEGKELVLK